MKKRSFRSTFVSVILVITVAISIVNLAVYGINIKKIRQVEVLKMKTAGERIDDMITISLNNIKGLKQICCTDNYARNILLKNNEKNDIGTKFENQNYMDNALKHIASMDTLILRATIVNKYGNIYCTDTSIPEEYVKTIRNMTKEWMLFEGKEDEYYYGGLQGDNANILTFLYPLHTYGNNGCGIDSEKREELNRILCERTRRISYIDEEEKSIGINNVNTRIKNYYGEKYGVKVNKADKGTEIQLLLGIENLEEENKDK